MTIDPQLKLLLDEQAIRNLIVSAWAALDSKDWPTYAEAFASDGVFEIMGQRREGRDVIVAGPARDLAKYDALQHIVSNELIRVDGDMAEGQWYAIAVHVPSAADASEHADVGLHYRFRARREADGWRFTEVALEPKWTAGMRFGIDELPDDA